MGCLVEKSGSSSWHKIFWTLREPTREFIPSKAYSENFAVMRTIDTAVWGAANNDPKWIRFLTRVTDRLKFRVLKF